MWFATSYNSSLNSIYHREIDQEDRLRLHLQHEHTLPPIYQARQTRQYSYLNQQPQVKSSNLQRLTPVLPKRTLTSQYSKKLRLSYKIHYGFSIDEVTMIENALQIVTDRLFKPEILKNMYDICGRAGYFLEPGLWKRSNLSKHSVKHGKEFLLRYQLACLKAKGENGEFPTIHIYPIFEQNEVMARGTSSCVTCLSRESSFSIEGEFEVKLNRFHLDNHFGALDWAGIIVHEMLHNLGHNHDEYDYSDRWQMNIFKECFIHDGNYHPMRYSSSQ